MLAAQLIEQFKRRGRLRHANGFLMCDSEYLIGS